MRLHRLDLLKYGHFDGQTLELAPSDPDFHVIFGANEAGKSTALSAIEDLLFEIPTRSPLGFLHGHPEMRVGGVLDENGEILEIIRRKGRSNTLLAPDGMPLQGGEQALAPFLGRAGRTLFERIFNLDHERLKAGGQAILEAEDDLGQTIFAAGSGFVEARKMLGELHNQADSLWAPRRSARRAYYPAKDRYDQARKDLREGVFTTAAWRQRKRERDEADEMYARIHDEFEKLSARRNQLGRIRRVNPDLQRNREIEDSIRALGPGDLLPEDAGKQIEESDRVTHAALARIESNADQIERSRTRIEQLAFDITLVQRAGDIAQLCEQRIEIRGEREDLPKREAELRQAETELRSLASGLGWQETGVAELERRLPEMPELERARSLLQDHGRLANERENSRRASERARADCAEAKRRLDAIAIVPDVNRLRASIEAVRRQGDSDTALRAATTQLATVERQVAMLVGQMHPAPTDEAAIVSSPVPAAENLARHRDQVANLRQRHQAAERQHHDAGDRLNKDRQAREDLLQTEQVVTPDQIRQARDERDNLWRQIVDLAARPSGSGADFETVAGMFSGAMQAADMLADQRFENAESAARHAEFGRRIEAEQRQLDKQNRELQDLAHEQDGLDKAWQAMWEGAPFQPLDVATMQEWINRRTDMLAAVAERDRLTIARDSLLTDIDRNRRKLLDSIAGIDTGIRIDPADSLSMVLELAGDRLRDLDQKALLRSQLAETLSKSETETRRTEAVLKQAESDWADWQRQWTNGLEALGLSRDSSPQSVSRQITIIGEMREKAREIRDLRDRRVDKIKRDIRLFEQSVVDLVAEIAPDLVGRPGEEGILALESRRDEAVDKQKQLETERRMQRDLEDQKAQEQKAIQEAEIALEYLRDLADVETNEALRDAIQRSDRLRALESEQQEIRRRLHEAGDGRSIEELWQECADVDIDEVRAREEAIEPDFRNLQQQLEAAIEARKAATEAFDAIGGGDGAARAAAAQQEAVAELEDIAGRYVRLRGPAILLQWAIDRYRRENQAPLLDRAGKHFETLTNGAFKGLSVTYDDQDKPGLTGIRHNDTTVDVSGMSTGTADQLFLALRVASIETTPENAGPVMPFVADDLFINFDDERAAAGFRVLGQLTRRTQVLFFTHHQHLVDIARATLGADIRVTRLPAPH